MEDYLRNPLPYFVSAKSSGDFKSTLLLCAYVILLKFRGGFHTSGIGLEFLCEGTMCCLIFYCHFSSIRVLLISSYSPLLVIIESANLVPAAVNCAKTFNCSLQAILSQLYG